MWHYTCSLKRRRAAWPHKPQAASQNPHYPSAWRMILIISKDSQNQFRNQSKNKLLSLQFLIFVVWVFNLRPSRLKITPCTPCIRTVNSFTAHCLLLSGFHCQTEALRTRQYLKVSSYRKFSSYGLPEREGQITKQISIPLPFKEVFSKL